MAHKKSELAQILLLMLRDYNARAYLQLESKGFGDIKPKHSAVLMHLGSYGPSRLNDLADSAGIRAQSMVKIIDEMQAAGYVVRRQDPKDSRAKQIAFTERGEQVIVAFTDITENIWQAYADIVGDDAFSHSMDCLDQLTKSIFCSPAE